ncbi:universal stress protein [Maribacter litopenaei]|uniref:universal stress protein n=1 Tax=Maribacter litopenaei TaxID=2976127 RepID=UPI003B849100
MNKRILIPTDFSKNALNAARYAFDLYAKLNCEFYFLNVFNLDGYTTKSLILPEP